MKKKQYILPCVEIVTVSGGYMMYGPASLPKDPFSAPAIRTGKSDKNLTPVF